MTVHLALSKQICDRQMVIKRFVLGLESMVSSASNLVKPYNWLFHINFYLHFIPHIPLLRVGAG